MRTRAGLAAIAVASFAPDGVEAHEIGPHPDHTVESSWINGCMMLMSHYNSHTDFKTAQAYTQRSGGCQTVGARLQGMTEGHYGADHRYQWTGWYFDSTFAIASLGPFDYDELSWLLVSSEHYRWHGGAGSAEVVTFAK